jgi:glutathione synthase/RimK-type ligase-like ATP-grasp enzyme
LAEIAQAAAHIAGADLVGVDLMITPANSWTIIELNGAVEFNHQYRLDGDIYDTVNSQLTTTPTTRPPRPQRIPAQ